MEAWSGLVFDLPDEGIDDWIACAGHDSLGLTVEALGDGRSRLRIYFDDSDQAAAVADRLRAAGLAVPGAEQAGVPSQAPSPDEALRSAIAEQPEQTIAMLQQWLAADSAEKEVAA